MAQSVSAAEAKAHFADLVAGVAFREERYVITRRGKPAAALVSVEDLKRLEQGAVRGRQPAIALPFVGAWGDIVTDEEIDQMVAEIYAARRRDTGRPVDLET